MKCYFCEQEARGICHECGRAACKEHGITTGHQRIMFGTCFEFACKECLNAELNPKEHLAPTP